MTGVVIAIALFFIVLNAVFMAHVFMRAFLRRSRLKREASHIDWYALSFGARGKASKDAP